MQTIVVDSKKMIRAVEKNMLLLDVMKEKLEREDYIFPSFLVNDIERLISIIEAYNNIFLSIYVDYDENGLTQ